MPNAAIVATALTDHSARTKSLTIGGLEVLQVPGAQGQRIGTLLDSVNVTEAAPGGVSTLRCLIDDPALALSLPEGAEVVFQDITRNVPIFRGILESVGPRPVGLGRAWQVQAIGIEALLDWLFVPSATIATGTKLSTAVQSLLAAAIPIGYPIRAFANGAASQQANPIADNFSFGSDQMGYAVTVTNQTLRQALYQCAAAVVGGFKGSPIVDFTIDFYAGLRMASWSGDAFAVFDWLAPMANIDGATVSGADWAPTTDYSRNVHAVYVIGANPAGSGLVTDGSGIVSRVETLTDQSSDTTAKRDAIGFYYLNQRQRFERGDITVEDQLNIGTAGSERHAGASVALMNAQAGIPSSVPRTVSEITKTWRGADSEVWALRLGPRPPSLVNVIRQRTRQLS